MTMQKVSAPNMSEVLFAEQLRRAGFAFEQQYVYAPPRRFRADFALIHFGLLIEIQGGIYSRQAHGSVSGVLADIERGNEAALAGWRVLRFTPDSVADGSALAFVLRVL